MQDPAASREQAKADIIRIGPDEAPSLIDVNGKERRREAQNLAERFREHAEAYFAFVTTLGMGPTNNVAEQAIGFVVIDRPVTQGTRSANGRRANERLWTVIGTCALQGRSAFAFIRHAVEAYFCNEPPPSLPPVPPRSTATSADLLQTRIEPHHPLRCATAFPHLPQ